VKVTNYFETPSEREDRAMIEPERVVASPEREHIQGDGRIRRWGPVPEMGNRYLRVVLLPDALHFTFEEVAT